MRLRKDSNPSASKEQQQVLNQAETAGLLAKLLDKIEFLEKRIDELEDTVEVLQATTQRVGRHLLESDPECIITYNNETGMCHTNHSFAFDYPVEMNDGLTVSDAAAAEFYGPLYMHDGVEVLGGVLWSDCPAMFTKGLEVRGGLIAFNTTTRVGNLTVEGTTVVGKTTFMDPVEFKDDVEFYDNVDFNDNVDFKGDKVDIYSEVTFEDDVLFKDDAAFKDDVAIYGPTSSDDSSTDFKVFGYVDVDFKQKKAMDVYPVTRFRDDVKLVHGGSSRSSSSRSKNKSRRVESDDDDEDYYSSESHDSIPQLIVEGDITTEMNLHVEGDLTVDGITMLNNGMEMEGDLTITEGDLELEEGDVVVDDGSVTVTGGDVTLTDGSVVVEEGNLDVTAGNADVGGDLFVAGAASGNADWTF